MRTVYKWLAKPGRALLLLALLVGSLVLMDIVGELGTLLILMIAVPPILDLAFWTSPGGSGAVRWKLRPSARTVITELAVLLVWFALVLHPIIEKKRLIEDVEMIGGHVHYSAVKQPGWKQYLGDVELSRIELMPLHETWRGRIPGDQLRSQAERLFPRAEIRILETTGQ